MTTAKGAAAADTEAARIHQHDTTRLSVSANSRRLKLPPTTLNCSHPTHPVHPIHTPHSTTAAHNHLLSRALRSVICCVTLLAGVLSVVAVVGCFHGSVRLCGSVVSTDRCVGVGQFTRRGLRSDSRSPSVVLVCVSLRLFECVIWCSFSPSRAGCVVCERGVRGVSAAVFRSIVAYCGYLTSARPAAVVRAARRLCSAIVLS